MGGALCGCKRPYGRRSRHSRSWSFSRTHAFALAQPLSRWVLRDSEYMRLPQPLPQSLGGDCNIYNTLYRRYIVFLAFITDDICCNKITALVFVNFQLTGSADNQDLIAIVLNVSLTSWGLPLRCETLPEQAAKPVRAGLRRRTAQTLVRTLAWFGKHDVLGFLRPRTDATSWVTPGVRHASVARGTHGHSMLWNADDGPQ